MAIEVPILSHSFTLDVSSTAKQFYLAAQSTATAFTAVLTTVKGQAFLGPVLEATSSGATAPIGLLGIHKIAHDGTLYPGAYVAASTSGLARASTGTGEYRGGFCLEAGSTVSGTITTCILLPQGQST